MRLSKQALRRQIREQKRAMSPEDIQKRSEILCKRVLQTSAYRHAETIYCYLPFNQEVNTLPLLRQALSEGKKIALPKCFGREMRFICVSDLTRVQASPFGAPEPVDDGPIAKDPAALVILPGLAFDPRGYRLGYGGGYYDRFLSGEPTHPTIALCFDFQMVPHLENESHDVPADTIFWV